MWFPVPAAAVLQQTLLSQIFWEKILWSELQPARGQVKELRRWVPIKLQQCQNKEQVSIRDDVQETILKRLQRWQPKTCEGWKEDTTEATLNHKANVNSQEGRSWLWLVSEGEMLHRHAVHFAVWFRGLTAEEDDRKLQAEHLTSAERDEG